MGALSPHGPGPACGVTSSGSHARSVRAVSGAAIPVGPQSGAGLSRGAVYQGRGTSGSSAAL